MADFSALKTSIQNYIKQNGNEEITGNLLQQVLLSMVTTLGDSAINDLVTALNNEVSARQNADGTLQGNINTLQGNINTLQGVVNGIKANIDNGYVYAGIANPSTTPASGKVFYLALTAGTYTNFGATVVPQGINILKYNGSAWSLDSFLGLDNAPTQGSNNLVKSGGVLDSIIKDGSAFDLSAYNSGTTYADLSAALTALNALPAAYKKGGMSMKFVQSSDNKYVQFRCNADDFSTNPIDWKICGITSQDNYNTDLYIIEDNDGNKAFFIRLDGSVDWSKGVPKPIVAALAEKVDKITGKSLIDSGYADRAYTSYGNWPYIIENENGLISFGINDKGEVEWSKGIPKPIYEALLTKVNIESGKVLIPAKYIQKLTETSDLKTIEDENGNIVFKINKHGKTWLQLENVPDVIQEWVNELLNKGNVPDYWQTYLDTKVAEINAKSKACGVYGDGFVFITDQHYPQNNGSSPTLINYILKNTSIRKVFNGGDYTKIAADASTATALAILRQVRTAFNFTDKYFTTRGNHDVDNSLSAGDFYSVFDRTIEEYVNIEHTNYYYFDNKAQKIRYIVLDCPVADYGGGQSQLDPTQAAWLENCITSLEAGWQILVFFHTYFIPGSSSIASIGTSAISHINAALAVNTDVSVIAVVVGHCHEDKAIKEATNGYWIIATTCDANTSMSAYDPVTPIRTPGTTTENIFDVYNIDTNNHKIYITRIGGNGTDREFNY